MREKVNRRIRVLPVILCLLFLLEITACGAAKNEGLSETLADTSASPLAAGQAGHFSDVPEGAWYAEAVEYCRQRGIMNGISDTAFAPEETLTRAMLATVLYRVEGSPAVSAPSGFSDVKAGTWYSDPISWAAKNGVVEGYGGGVFGVDDSTTREQAVTILWRCAGDAS